MTFDDIKHILEMMREHDVTEFALGAELGQHAADLSAADESDLLPC